MDKKALVLLSGGLDSSVVCAIVRHQGYRCVALTFSYGQRHRKEVEAAHEVGLSLGVEDFLNVELRLPEQSSMLLDKDAQFGTDLDETRSVAYVPARNLIFLSHALCFAETFNIWDIFIGVNKDDYIDYPDCRIEFFQSFMHTANLALQATTMGTTILQIHMPLLHMYKEGIVGLGLELGVDFSKTSSCYSPSEEGWACGICSVCKLRLKAFAANNIRDPIRYQLSGGD